MGKGLGRREGPQARLGRMRQEVEEAVRATLLAGVPLDPGRLRVTSAGGVAYIDGVVASFRDKQLSSTLASQVGGVHEVVNRLRVVPTGPRSDAALRLDLQDALHQDPRLRASAIAVNCVNGVVELTGRVPDFATRCQAERLAWSAPGIRGVISRLEMMAPGEWSLCRDILQCLQGCLDLAPASIGVGLWSQAIVLWGTVPSSYHKHMAEELARWHCQGRDVLNYLRVVEEKPGEERLTA